MKFFAHHRCLAVATFFVFILLFTPTSTKYASAQTSSDFSIQLSPESPGPLENVTAKLISFSTDLDRLNISWSLNGKTSSSGVGKRDFLFKTGNIGSIMRLDVSLTGNAGKITKSLTIEPGSVDMLWQVVDGYTPPFYRGKSLPVSGSNIKIVAVPNLTSGGSSIKSPLVYKWSRGYRMLESSSGYNKDSLVFHNNILDPAEKIAVEVSSLSGSSKAQGVVSLDMGQPLILFYENSPLRGVRYEQAILGSFGLKEGEAKITAEPYFISASGRQDTNIKYGWKLNGETVPGSTEDLSSLVLRNEGGSGEARVSLSISSAKKIMQSAVNSFMINF